MPTYTHNLCFQLSEVDIHLVLPQLSILNPPGLFMRIADSCE